jgi:hypothetical protein
MERKIFPSKSIVVIMLLFGFILLFIQFYSSQHLSSEYIRISSRDSIINISVENKVKVHFIHGLTFITLSNGSKISFGSAENRNYSQPTLDGFIESGDIILKHKDSDTIYINRRGKEYYFLLDAW